MTSPRRDPLCEALADGREEAFANLYDRFALRMFRVAVAILVSTHDAEDAVQDTFVSLVRFRRGFRTVRNLRAYVLGAARNAAVRRLRRRSRTPAPVDPADLALAAPSPAPLPTDRAARLQRALRTLPPEQRDVVALHVDGGLTLAETADALGLRLNNVASRYRYALQKLRAGLEDA